MIRNVQFSGYCVYINTKIQGDFQISISVPLIQGVQRTLTTRNDGKLDLVTPRTLNSSKFEQDDLENPENFIQEVSIKLKFSNLTVAIGESLFQIFFPKLSPKVKEQPVSQNFQLRKMLNFQLNFSKSKNRSYLQKDLSVF